MNTHMQRTLGMPGDMAHPSDTFGSETPVLNDEELVPDVRSGKRPAEVVEDKLSGMLKGHGVRISQLRHRTTAAART